MNRYFLLLLLVNLGYSQATGFAIYGVGENIQNCDAASMSLGNSSYFSGNSKNISTVSPSSLWRSTLTRFTIHSGLNYLKHTILPDQYQHSLTSFSMLFPVGNKKVFGFGIQPVYRTNSLNITDKNFHFIGADESLTGSPIAYKNHYSIDGGISALFMEYSQKLYPHISGGIKYSFLFGTQFLEDKLWTYDVQISEDEISYETLIKQIDNIFYYAIEVDSTIVNKFNQFSGTMLNLEGRYTLPQHEWVFNASISGTVKVKTERIQCLSECQPSGINSDTSNYENSADAILSDFGFGYHYQTKNNSGITIEVHKKYPFNIPEHSALFDIMPPGENSMHFGSYFQIRNSKIGFWNNLNVRYGVFLKELDFTGEFFLDYGATIGMGIEYLGHTQVIDLALRTGKKESRIFEGEYEEYISCHIGITTGEKWFMKRRRQ